MSYQGVRPALRRYGGRHSVRRNGNGCWWNLPCEQNPCCDGYRAGTRSLGGIFDDLFPSLSEGLKVSGQADIGRCLAQAGVQTAPLEDKINDLAVNWRPSETFSPEQIIAAVSEVLRVLSTASETVRSAPNATSDAEQMKAESLSQINRSVQESLEFTNAVQVARNQGIRAISAPGLKRWVVKALQNASFASTNAILQRCTEPALSAAYRRFVAALDAALALLKKIAGVLAELGKAVLNIPDKIGEMFTIMKWGAAAGVGIWVFLEIKKRRQAKTA